MAAGARPEVGFYQLSRWPLERALPRLLERARDQNLRCLVRCASRARLDHLNAHLWTYDGDSFLAHGGPEDGRAGDQPIFLTCAEENPNGATVLILTEGVEAGDLESFARCLDLFDGNDEAALAAARRRWRALGEKGTALTYWSQGEGGRWEKRADA